MRYSVSDLSKNGQYQCQQTFNYFNTFYKMEIPPPPPKKKQVIKNHKQTKPAF